MKPEMNFDNLQLDFLKEDPEPLKKSVPIGTYKLMIADDDREVHMITKMILKDFVFEGKKLEFVHAYTGEETKRLLVEHPDTAILFLDVVMESHQSGLEVVGYLRETLKNNMTRIVLRTGQPGEAPEEEVIKQYDINDYRLKTELTVKRMHTTLYTALRNYRDLLKLERHKKGLERIIEASSLLFQQNQLEDFLTSVLNELSNFYQDQPGMIYLREHGEGSGRSGFVSIEQHRKVKIVAATGKYEALVGRELSAVPELDFMSNVVGATQHTGYGIEMLESGFVIRSSSGHYVNNYIFIEGGQEIHDFELIESFLVHYGLAFDQYIAKNLNFQSQQRLLDAYREAMERQFKKPLNHIQSVTGHMRGLALQMGYSTMEADLLAHAASLHDLGMIRLPEHILLRQAPLTPDEYEIIKAHTQLGFEMLSLHRDELFVVAAEIAKYHHEHFDGTGYPSGLKGNAISEAARMMAVIDVYVSMTSDKVYGLGKSHEEAMAFIDAQSGTRFDPMVVQAFIAYCDSKG